MDGIGLLRADEAQKFISALEWTFGAYQNIPSPTEGRRTGLVSTLLALPDSGYAAGVVLHQCVVGDTSNFTERYYRHSLEKALRLLGNPQHLTSWESANRGPLHLEAPEPDPLPWYEKKWPGAVRIGNFAIHSVSGLNWDDDEAIAACSARLMRWMEAEELDRIHRITNNGRLNMLRQQVFGHDRGAQPLIS